jgi:hypothetical protein
VVNPPLQDGSGVGADLSTGVPVVHKEEPTLGIFSLHGLEEVAPPRPEVGVADKENTPGNLIAQLLKNEDHFPTTAFRGQSESDVRFPQKRTIRGLKVIF